MESEKVNLMEVCDISLEEPPMIKTFKNGSLTTFTNYFLTKVVN